MPYLVPVGADPGSRPIAGLGLYGAGRGGPRRTDAGYWHTQQIRRIVADGMQVLIPPDSGLRADARPRWEGGLYAFIRRVLSTDHGYSLYSKRKHSIVPVFGQIKGNRRIDRFQRRGRAAVRSEWRLITASHNLLKLHSHWIQPATG
jgi:hypothetical protein